MPEIYNNLGEKNPTEVQKDLNVSGAAKHSTPGHTHNPLGAFCFRPDNVTFETQDQGEKVVLFLRQHPIVNLPWIALAILLFFAPVILINFPLLSFLPANFQFIAHLIWYLLVAAYSVESALAWFFNIYIVTDERIVDIDFTNLIHREITEAKIDNIQDTHHAVGGVLRTIFNYGDVIVQTAGTAQNIEFERVPNPASVSRIIQELRLEEEQEKIEGRVR